MPSPLYWTSLVVPTCLACLTYPTANAVLQSNTLDVVLQVKLVVCFLLSRDHDYDMILTHPVSHPADLHLMMPSPFNTSPSVTTWPHIHTSRIACKSLAFLFLPIRVAGPSRLNGWLSPPLVITAESAVGRSSAMGLGGAGGSTSGPGSGRL